jgi:GNAT superfamily N-acetyltransferase
VRTRVARLEADLRDDFFRLHCDAHGCGWCHCVAWWVPGWEGFGERSARENRTLREQLFARGEHDGYLLYVEDEPAGWCQVGPRDRLAKLVRQYDLPPDDGTWALSCFLIAPAQRRRGLTGLLLAEVLADLRARGVRRLEAYPRRGEGLDPLDLWAGPESVYRAAGFRVVRDDAARPVLAREL